MLKCPAVPRGVNSCLCCPSARCALTLPHMAVEPPFVVTRGSDQNLLCWSVDQSERKKLGEINSGVVFSVVVHGKRGKRLANWKSLRTCIDFTARDELTAFQWL